MKEFIISYEDKFSKFVRRKAGSGTNISYHSYLKSLNEQFFEINEVKGDLRSPFDLGQIDRLSEEDLTLLDEWKKKLMVEIETRKYIKRSKKTIQNWRSAFTMYVNFITFCVRGEVPKPEKKERQVSNVSKRPRASEPSLKQKEIFKKICGCFRGQDRASKKRATNLPLNVISQIDEMYGNPLGYNIIDKWGKKLAPKVIAWIREENGDVKEIFASEIIELRIYKNRHPVDVVYREGKEKKRAILLTRVSKKDRKMGKEKFEEMYLEKKDQLHIDHNPTVDSILKKFGGKDGCFPMLTEVTRIIREVAKKNGLNETKYHDSKLTAAIKEDEAARTKIRQALPELEAELEKFDEFFKRYEFRLGKDNCSDGNRYDED